MSAVLLVALLAVVLAPSARAVWLGRLDPQQLMGSWYVLAVASGEKDFALEKATKSVEGVEVMLTSQDTLKMRASRHRWVGRGHGWVAGPPSPPSAPGFAVSSTVRLVSGVYVLGFSWGAPLAEPAVAAAQLGWTGRGQARTGDMGLGAGALLCWVYTRSHASRAVAPKPCGSEGPNKAPTCSIQTRRLGIRKARPRGTAVDGCANLLGILLHFRTLSVPSVNLPLCPMERCHLQAVELRRQNSGWVFGNPSLGVLEYRVLGTNFRDYAIVFTQLEAQEEAFSTVELYSRTALASQEAMGHFAKWSRSLGFLSQQQAELQRDLTCAHKVFP
ncbi:epididymal-specific lipocalin-6 [Muntiacus reevesi]|uniref:epididymal-specific lipocalin-6 n=1 Tax=Muntiacus reevesi TaxID=9886 RepID=UPI003307631A